jgi:hypothetical protein
MTIRVLNIRFRVISVNDIPSVLLQCVNRWHQIGDALAHRSPHLDLEQTGLLLIFDIFGRFYNNLSATHTRFCNKATKAVI